MIIIPIGIDCGLANLLQEYKLRNFSLPFDWCVSYNGISRIIKNNFDKLIPENVGKNILNKKYDIFFFHNIFPDDTEKMRRRVNRLKDILENSNDTVIFFRKGHASHHHLEHDYKELKSDICDAEDLDIILQTKYPNLDYKIIVVLVCYKCFDININYISNSSKIRIYNITSINADDNKFRELFIKIIEDI
jgi:hypothetical protein